MPCKSNANNIMLKMYIKTLVLSSFKYCYNNETKYDFVMMLNIFFINNIRLLELILNVSDSLL